MGKKKKKKGLILCLQNVFKFCFMGGLGAAAWQPPARLGASLTSTFERSSDGLVL
jgi:hypothetical protein